MNPMSMDNDWKHVVISRGIVGPWFVFLSLAARQIGQLSITEGSGNRGIPSTWWCILLKVRKLICPNRWWYSWDWVLRESWCTTGWSESWQLMQWGTLSFSWSALTLLPEGTKWTCTRATYVKGTFWTIWYWTEESWYYLDRVLVLNRPTRYNTYVIFKSLIDKWRWCHFSSSNMPTK